jgi:Leucine-rich repeat (LRR) protein
MGGLLSTKAGDTELDRSRTEGDFTSSEVVEISRFFARAVLIKMKEADADASPIQKLLKMCVLKLQPLNGTLTKLDFRKNLLKKIPKSIKKLPMLKELDLSDCQFKRFPREVCEVSTLEVLRLSGNHLRRLEHKHNIRNLRKLRELALDGNRMEHLCDDICTLAGLRIINLSNNNFKRFPSDVCGCVGLEELYMEQNGLTYVDMEIDNLKMLKTFALGANRFTEVPAPASMPPALHKPPLAARLG